MDERARANPRSGFLWGVLGFLAVSAYLATYLFLGERSIVSVRDQLDGEIAAYFLGAKHLFDGGVTFPEWMGGVPRSALTPPSPLTVLFYRFFDLFPAFLLNLTMVTLVAYQGMYALLRRLTGNEFVSACCGVIFAFLPFQTVYGLSVAGVPLAALAYLRLRGRENAPGFAYALLALYAGFSSPVLVGFAVVILFGAGAAVETGKGIRAPRAKEAADRASRIGSARALYLAAGELILIYAALNFRLLRELLVGGGERGHKSEYVHYGQAFWESFWTLLSRGNIAAVSLHGIAFWVVLAVMALSLALRLPALRGPERGGHQALPERARSLRRLLFGGFAAASLIAAFYAFVQSEPVAAFRNRTGSALASFQIDRFYWLYPALWYAMLAAACSFLWELGDRPPLGGQGGERAHSLGMRLFSRTLVAGILAVCGAYVLQSSPLRANLRELVRPEGSTSLAWEDYFAREEYAQIAEYLRQERGLSQEAYRVGSLGLEPAVAAVNGFYTIDGYSNNYPLTYKHAFREAIARELDRNAYNRAYFDEWGNRCYLFSAQYNGNALLSKYEHAYFAQLELDTGALKALGCGYLLAAGEIADAEEKGYRLLRVFDSYEYLYVIYLYEIL